MLQFLPSLFSTALVLKLTVVAWIALALRMAVQQERKQHALLALLCVALSTASAFLSYETSPITHSCTAFIATVVAFLCWTQGSHPTWNQLLPAAGGLGLLLSLGGYYRSVQGDQPIAAWLLLAANCLAAAVALAYAIEMTGFLSPGDLRESRSNARTVLRWLSTSSLFAFVIASAALATVAFGPGPISSIDGGRMRDEFRIIAWLFSATILLVQFVVWYGLRRTLLSASVEEKTERSKVDSNLIPREWGSLTISAWIAVVALLVALAVPMSWPWEVEATSDALIGELLD